METRLGATKPVTLPKKTKIKGFRDSGGLGPGWAGGPPRSAIAETYQKTMETRLGATKPVTLPKKPKKTKKKPKKLVTLPKKPKIKGFRPPPTRAPDLRRARQECEVRKPLIFGFFGSVTGFFGFFLVFFGFFGSVTGFVALRQGNL